MWRFWLDEQNAIRLAAAILAALDGERENEHRREA